MNFRVTISTALCVCACVLCAHWKIGSESLSLSVFFSFSPSLFLLSLLLLFELFARLLIVVVLVVVGCRQRVKCEFFLVIRIAAAALCDSFFAGIVIVVIVVVPFSILHPSVQVCVCVSMCWFFFLLTETFVERLAKRSHQIDYMITTTQRRNTERISGGGGGRMQAYTDREVNCIWKFVRLRT